MSLGIAIALLGLGLVFIVAEVLFPSFGILTLLASVCVITSVAMAFARSTGTGVQFLICVSVAVPAAILLGLKVLPRSPFGRYMVARGLSFGSTSATDERDVALLGREGTTESPLMPTGIARFDGRRVDVISRGEPLEAGRRVRVLEVRGNRVVVGPIAPDTPAPSTTTPPPPPESRPPA